MWYGKQAGSPASSTSTVDQQEIIFDDNQFQQQKQPSTIYQLQQTSTNSTANVVIVAPGTAIINNITPTPAQTNKRQTNSTPRATKRPRNTNSQYARVNGINNSSSSGNSRGANLNSNTTGNSKCSPPKRPKLYNQPQQVAPWKSLQHHFLRHTDVKYRPEKRMTMAELGNEVLQRRNGWKVHHLVGQLTDLIQNELKTRQRINSLLELFIDQGAKKIHVLANNCHKLPEQYAALLQSQRSYGKNEFRPELIVTKLDDLLRGDLQRSNMFDDLLRDCRDLIVRTTNEHRDRVARITTKFNKRIQL